jgi:hypothetical protein
VAEAAGWYADPSGKTSTYRWWDGQAWTRWLSADPGAADPGPVEMPAEPVVARRAAVDFPPPDEATAYAPPDPGDRVVRLPAAAAILVGGVLLAIIAVGAVISLTADRPLTGPAVAPPTPTETPLTVAYDSATRELSAEELQVTLPARPFSCDIEPRVLPNVFASTFSCTAWVHSNYNDDEDDWIALIGLGVLEERLQTGPDLDAIAKATFAALADLSYDLDKVTVKKQKTEPLTGVAPQGKAVLTTADMHVDDKDLPTTYDRMVVAAFELESGQHAAYYVIRPNDSKSDVTDALRRSAETVTARK